MDPANTAKSSSDNGATTVTGKGTGLQIGEVYQLATPDGIRIDGWFYLPTQMARGVWSPQKVIAKPEPPKT